MKEEECLSLKRQRFKILKGHKEGKALTVKEKKVNKKVIQKTNKIIIKQAINNLLWITKFSHTYCRNIK